MPVPIIRVNMGQVVQRIISDKQTLDSDKLDRAIDGGQAGYDAWKIAWLSQYDEHGILKPGIFSTRAYIPNREHGFMSMDSDAQAEYVVNEKRRLGQRLDAG